MPYPCMQCTSVSYWLLAGLFICSYTYYYEQNGSILAAPYKDIAQREKRACESSKSGYEAIMARLDEADKARKILEDEVADLKRQSLGLGNASQIDTPMLASELNRLGALSHFTVIRKLEGGIFPMGFTKEVTDRNLKAGLNILGVESSERALLNRLMLELHKLDSDVLVGHNISRCASSIRLSPKPSRSMEYCRLSFGIVSSISGEDHRYAK